MNSFWNTVPRPARIAAVIIVSLAALAGVFGGSVHGSAPGRVLAIDMLGGLLLSLFVGCLIGIWVACLGYVCADARRRAMPPVLWTLVAALVPNLLGFLLYFAIRRPVAAPCPRCARPATADQRFCSWCGYEMTVYPPIPPQQPDLGARPAV